MFYFLVLPLVLWGGLGLGRGLACKLEALLHRAEELAGDVVHVLQGGDNVGGAGDGLEQLDPLEGVRDLVHALQPVAVSEEDLDPLVVVLLGRVEQRRAVDLGAGRTRVRLALVGELLGFVLLVPLEDGVQDGGVFLHGGRADGVLNQLSYIGQSLHLEKNGQPCNN